jgi:rhodanese-related sulfurtransferase
MKRRGIAEVLAEAQARLHRLTPAEAAAAVAEGATLVEWRVDPTSGSQSAALAGCEDKLILICHERYSSSLAAIRLHELGFTRTTDVIGGFVAWGPYPWGPYPIRGPYPWAAAGLPVDR